MASVTIKNIPESLFGRLKAAAEEFRRRFPAAMAPDETALSLEHRTLECLGGMFRDFVARVQRGEPIPSVPQGPGRSATKREMLSRSICWLSSKEKSMLAGPAQPRPRTDLQMMFFWISLLPP